MINGYKTATHTDASDLFTVKSERNKSQGGTLPVTETAEDPDLPPFVSGAYRGMLVFLSLHSAGQNSMTPYFRIGHWIESGIGFGGISVRSGQDSSSPSGDCVTHLCRK